VNIINLSKKNNDIKPKHKILLYTFPDFPKINEIRNNTIKTKNRILAIDAAPAAIPPKPNTAAIIAIIKNVTVQRNISLGFIKKNNISTCTLKKPCHD